jgi:hydrogenase-4 component E
VILELVFPGLVVLSAISLIENRISRVVRLLSLSGILCLGPILEAHPNLNSRETMILIAMDLIFKAFLTPTVLLWSSKKIRVSEESDLKGMYFPALLLILCGASVCFLIAEKMAPLPGPATPLNLTCTLIVIYIGFLHFLYRKHWIPLMVGFSIFENGIFSLSQLLNTGLPMGLEFGAFMDAVMTLVAAATIQIWAHEASPNLTGQK